MPSQIDGAAIAPDDPATEGRMTPLDAPAGEAATLTPGTSLADLVIGGAATFLLIAYWPGLSRASPVLLPLVAFPLGVCGLAGLVVLVVRGDHGARWAAGFLGWAAISTAASAQPRLSFDAGYAADRGWIYLAAFLGCWALGRRRGPEGARIFTIGLFAGLALNGVLAFGQVWIEGSGLFQLYGGRASAFPLNPVFLGALMSGAMALAAAHLAGAGRRWWVWLGPVGFFAAVANLSGSRVAIVAGLVLALAAARVGGLVRVVAVALALVVGFGIGGQLLSSTGTGRLDPRAEAASGGFQPRLLMWEAGIDAALERPLTGWGPNRFRPATNQAVDLEFTLSEGPERLYFDAHNVFVEQLTTVGIPGVLLLVGFVVSVARHARGPLAWYGAGAAATWLLEPVAISTAPTAMLALGFACIPPGRTSPDPPIGRPGARTGMRAATVVAALLLTGLAARSVYVDHLAVEGDDETDLVADFARAAELMPNDPSVADMHTQALMFDAWFTRDPEVRAKALAAAERAVDLDPTYSALWNRVGSARLQFQEGPRAERLSSAREAFEAALERSPWSTAAMSGLFQISLEQGRPDEARDWLIAMCAAGRCPRLTR